MRILSSNSCNSYSFLWKFLIIAILLLNVELTGLAINPAITRIADHRAWMKTNFPGKDASIEDKLRGVHDILSADLQEDEVKALFEYIRDDCKEFTPYTDEVENYIRNIASNEVDVECKCLREAILYFHNFSKFKFGEFHPITVMFRVLQLEKENNYSNQWRAAKAYADQLQKNYENDSNQENLEIATVSRVVAMACDASNRFSFSSNDYLEIMKMEKEIKRVFPPKSDKVNHWRLLAYKNMGYVMESIRNEQDFNVAVRGTEFEYKMVPDDGTEYSALGTERTLTLNTPWYFKEAYNLGVKLYGANHPISNILLYKFEEYESKNFVVNRERTSCHNDTFTYLKYYYPEHNLYALSSRVGSWAMSMVNNEHNSDIQNVDDIMLLFKQYWGEGNPKYIESIWSPIISISKLNPNSDAYVNLLIRTVDNCDVLDACEKLIMKLIFCNGIYSIRPEWAKTNLSSIYIEFLKIKDYSYDLLQLGADLKEYYKYTLNDYKTSALISSLRNNVLRELEGALSHTYREAECDFVLIKFLSDPKEAPKFLKDEIERENANDDSLKNFYIEKLKAVEIEGYFFGKQDFVKTEKLAREWLKNSRVVNEDLIQDVRSLLANSINFERGATPESESIMEDVLNKIIHKDAIKRDFAILENLFFYFYQSNDPVRSQMVLDVVFETLKAKTGNNFDENYLAWRENQVKVMMMTGDLNSVRRIVSEDLDRLESYPYYVPTVNLLHYIWEGYYATKQDNRFDVMILYFFQKLNKYLLKFYNTSSDKEAFERVHFLPLIYETFDNAISWKQFIDNNKGNFTEEQMSKNEMMRINYDSQLKTLIGFGNKFVNNIPKHLGPGDKIRYLNLMLNLSQISDIWYGNSSQAENYLNKAKRFASDDKNMIVEVESCRAAFYLRHGDMDMAEKSFRVKVEDVKNNPYSDFASRKYVQFFYFNYYKEKGLNSKAIEEAKSFYNIMQDELNTHFQLMTVSDQENFMNTHGDPASLLSIMLEYEPEKLASDVYNGLLYRTGMQLRSQQSTQKAIAVSDDANLKLLCDSINLLNAQRSRLNIGDDDSKNQVAAVELVRKIRRIEQQLFDKTAYARKDVTKSVTWNEISDALKPNEAAIEFAFSDQHIMALILRNGCKAPEVVELSATADLENFLKNQNTRNSAAMAMKIYGKDKPQLYQMLWQPMEKTLEGAEIVYLAAPGILHGISFNAMCDMEGKYLFDKYSILQLTTTAQICESDLCGVPKSAALIGDVLFEPGQKDLIGKPINRNRDVDDEFILDDFDTRGAKHKYFPYLPFTSIEIDKISKELGAIKPSIVKWSDATEFRLRQICESKPEILHLATHGFFLPDERTARKVPYMMRFIGNIGSSMQRAGIALADAEEAWIGTELPDENDGILTALEISQLNLKDTRLVVLSACETALGTYNYEGIYGLPRGFKQAGVKSLIVSLWKVNDCSTSEFMTEFYTSWCKGNSIHEAYRAAIKAVREKYPEPFHWAPFILLDGK